MIQKVCKLKLLHYAESTSILWSLPDLWFYTAKGFYDHFSSASWLTREEFTVHVLLIIFVFKPQNTLQNWGTEPDRLLWTQPNSKNWTISLQVSTLTALTIMNFSAIPYCISLQQQV